MDIFASDFDGTLRIYDGQRPYFRPEDIEAVRSFQNEGGLFGICTGRPLFWMLECLDPGIKPDFAVASTGALISRYDGTWKTLYQRTIARQPLLTLCRALYMDYAISVSDAQHMYVFNEERMSSTRSILLKDPDSLPDTEVTAVSVFAGNAEKASVLTQQINAQYAGSLSAYQNIDYIDIVAAGVSKGTGMAEAKRILQADRTGGIGDSFNDLPLLQASDISFTFRKSPAELQSRADYSIDSVAEALQIFRNTEG